MKFAFVILACVSVPVAAAIQVTVVQPTPGQLAGDSLFVAATVTSTFELASVTASVADRTPLLTFSPAAVPGRFGATPGWTNTVSLDGLERGAFTITVTARDLFGAESSSQTSFKLDRRPVLRITAPLQDTVTKFSVPVDFSFSDDGPNRTTIRILTGSILLSTNPVTSLNLSAYDHPSVSGPGERTDARNHHTQRRRHGGVFRSGICRTDKSILSDVVAMKDDQLIPIQHRNSREATFEIHSFIVHTQ